MHSECRVSCITPQLGESKRIGQLRGVTRGSGAPAGARTVGRACPSAREFHRATRCRASHARPARRAHRKPLEPARISLPSGARVDVDGADLARSVLVECWAHQGPPKGGQKHKVLTDAFKLTWIASTIYPRPELILCMSDPRAAAAYLPTSKSWAAQALSDLAIRIELIEPPDERETPSGPRRPDSFDNTRPDRAGVAAHFVPCWSHAADTRPRPAHRSTRSNRKRVDQHPRLPPSGRRPVRPRRTCRCSVEDDVL